MTGTLDDTNDVDRPGSMRADSPATPTPQLPATRTRLFDRLPLSEERDPLKCVVGYPIASLFPGTGAFLTSLSSSTPLSYAATHADTQQVAVATTIALEVRVSSPLQAH